MKQATLSQNGNSLLNDAISRLSPEVFSHPVWMRFGQKELSGSLSIIDDLLSAAKNLQNEDPSSACQVLLICAVYQNYAGQRYNALKTTQQALALAKRNGFARETIWALWGTCAISVQQGNYEQAAESLVDLQATLSEQNEWILAVFVDMLRQSLFQHATVAPGNHHSPPDDHSFVDLLSLTFEWLQSWGFSEQAFEPEFEPAPAQPSSHAAGQPMLDQPLVTDDSEIPKGYVFGVPKQSPPPKALPSLKRPVSTPKRTLGNHGSAPAVTIIPVAVHMLGVFSMTIGDLTVKVPASRGLSLLKYLLLHHKQNVSREVLMDIFWPDAEPETARNNLNVAMHSLRKALRSVIFLPVIVFSDGAYGLEPSLQIWFDVEEFERCVKAAQRLEARNQVAAAVAEYEAAISLYQGDFLEQNPYEEWTILERERLRVAYLDTLDRLSQIYSSQERYAACITVCQLILTRDRCREDTHCLMMRCYSRQGQYHLALRQFRNCVEALRVELDVEPALETTELYGRIRRREHV